MKLSQNGYNLIKQFEGCRLKAYPDPATGGEPFSIGYGNTFYEDKEPVKEGDEITQQEANLLFELVADEFAKWVDMLVKSSLNQNQFDALVSFAYNVGIENLKKSTLLKQVNENPCGDDIPHQFSRWNKAAGKELAGLTKRRAKEAELYKKVMK